MLTAIHGLRAATPCALLLLSAARLAGAQSDVTILPPPPAAELVIVSEGEPERNGLIRIGIRWNRRVAGAQGK
jgi:hypothetical protein